MASICKRCRHKRDEWDTCGCQWLIRRQEAGRVLYTPAGRTRAAAERALARLDAAPQETVAQALDEWLSAKEREHGARPNSIASYRVRVRHVEAALGHVAVRSLRAEHLTAFVAQTLSYGFAPATVQGIYQALTASLRHAQRRGVIRHLPLPPEGPGIPEVRARSHPLSLVEVEEVIERLPGVWGKVAEIVLLTGLRWGEVVAIEPGDIDGHLVHIRRTRNRTGGVNPPKTKQGLRVVPLSDRALDLLDGLDLPVGGDYRRAREALVHAMGPLHRKGMGWHSIRAAHASLLDAANLSLREQASRMGHGANYAVTFSYQLAREAGDARQLDAVRHAATSDPSEAQAATPRAPRPRRRRAP